jgi:hypothetical protein
MDLIIDFLFWNRGNRGDWMTYAIIKSWKFAEELS